MEQMELYSKTLFGTFEDSIDEENQTVSGFFTDGLIDDHGHMIDESAMMKGINEYRKWSNIRDMHGGPVGTAVEVGARAWNYVTAKIIKSDVWELVKAGVYRGFSVGIIVTDGIFVPVEEIPEEKFFGVAGAVRSFVKELGYVFKITELALVEISIVDRPANPRAVFAASKSGGVHQLNVLPSIFDDESMVAIKSVYGSDRKNAINIDKDSVFVANVEASLQGGDIDATEEETEEVMSEDITVETAEVEVVDEVETVESEVVETESEPAEDTGDAEVEKSMTVTISDIEAVAEKIVDRINQEIAKAMSGIAKSMEEIEASLSNRTESTPVDEDVDGGEPAAEYVENSLSDEDIEKIADVVAEKIVASRKSVVSSDGSGVDKETVNIKEIDNKSLVSLIARGAIR